MSSRSGVRAWSWSVVLAVVLVTVGCADKRDELVPVVQHADTLVVLKGPDLSRRADSSVVVVEVDAPDGKKLGTAFVVDTLGLLVTNRHVVEGVSHVSLRGGVLADTVDATVVFTSTVCDLAILHVAGLGLPPLSIDRKDEAQVGEHVYSIGHPRGLEYSVSDGIVSGIRRIPGESTHIQFTASISHGSSGGPLLDDYGRVVGMNEAYIDAGQNLNFAVPVEEIRNGLAMARAILVGGVDRTLIEGEAEFRLRHPGYAAEVVLDSTTIVQEVNDLLEKHAIDTAWELAQRAMAAFPEHFDLFVVAEKVAFKREMYDVCEVLIDRMSAIQPYPALTLKLRGDVLDAQRRFSEAHQRYQECLSFVQPCEPIGREALSMRARCSFQMGEYQAAVNEFNVLMECDGGESRAENWALLAVCLKFAGRLSDADDAAIRARQMLRSGSPLIAALDLAELPRPVVVTSVGDHDDYLGRRFIAGVVRNQSGAPIQDVFVSVEGLDENGALVASGTGEVEMPILLPTMTSAFDIEVKGILSRMTRIQARVIAYH